MASASPANPLGYVPIVDGANPRIITATAIEAVSGGVLVAASGAAPTVISGLSSFVDGDLSVFGLGSGAAFNGVTVGAAASGGVVGVATRGLVIVKAGGTVTAGLAVMSLGDSVLNLTSGSETSVLNVANNAAKYKIGRAWTNAASGSYCVIDLNP